QAGPVITVKIPKDRDGRPKQFAFVNFKHEESVPYGLRLLNGIKLYGRPMRIQFRSGSSHAAQDVNPSCSQLGINPPGMPHPASNCSRVPDGMATPGYPSSLQRQAVVRAHTHRHRLGGQLGGLWAYEQPGFAPPGYPHSFHALPGSPGPRRSEGPALRKGRLGTHPYPPDSRHFGRERFGECGPDYGRGKREEYGFDERGHEAEHHYRGSREEHYDDRHRDSWSYEYRRESYREPKWHSSRH
ncbi:RBM7 protein, partial [Certhia familiaris]|nr:RBM7 protein [Certhia familiaris]